MLDVHVAHTEQQETMRAMSHFRAIEMDLGFRVAFRPAEPVSFEIGSA